MVGKQRQKEKRFNGGLWRIH